MARIDWERGSSLRQALHKLYGGREWALFYEVADTTGYSATRSADAIAMNMFPSRGCEIHGFEIKMRRGDWLSELKRPEKAERISTYCDFWWLVTGNQDVAKLEEIPGPWGWYEFDGKKMEVKKRPKKMKAMPLDRGFVAAVLRRSAEMFERERKRAAETIWRTPEAKKLERDLESRLKSNFETEIELVRREKAALEREIAAFEEKSGIKIDAWNGGRMGDAVKMVSNLKTAGNLDSLSYLAKDMEDRIRDIRKGVDDLKRAAASVIDAGKMTV